MDNLFLNTIRISIKANKYSFGETLLFDIRSNRAKVVVIATDSGKASQKKIMDKCKTNNVPYYVMLTKEKLSNLFHKNLSSFGIIDENLALKLIENLNKGGISNGNN